MSGITYFGQTDFRNEQRKFGIKDKDRLRHIYIIGKTGVGKSTLIENMIAQDILNGNGCAFLDPHGASAEKMLDYIPSERVDDVVYFAPFDMAHPISFNIMEDVGPDKRHHVANGILSVMKKIWVDAFSGRMEYIIQNVLLALMETPGTTLLGINRMLSDKEYRKMIIDNIQDPSVKSFWVDEYLKWDERYQREAGAAIQNKIGQFTSNPLIRNIIGQPKSSFDIRELMDNKKILIANFSKGLLGEQNARLLGSFLSTSIYLAAMSRAELPEEEMEKTPPFYLYVDEFQNFANDSFADVLSEARKYKLSLTMAHQYIAQMPDTVREAIFGNVGTMITFRIGPEDAEAFEREFTPTFMAADFTNLGPYQIYLRLMIDGLNSSPFSARTLPPIPTAPVSMKLQAFQRSRELYGNKREDVEAAINAWFVPIPSKKQLEHQDYLEKKKAEVEAAGGVWVDRTKEDASSSTTKPYHKKAPEGVYRNLGHKDQSTQSMKPVQHNSVKKVATRLGADVSKEKQKPLGVRTQNNKKALDTLVPPAQVKKMEYKKKKEQDEKNPPIPTSQKKQDDEPARITLSSDLKALLDNLDESDYQEPIRIKDIEKKTESSSHNIQPATSSMLSASSKNTTQKTTHQHHKKSQTFTQKNLAKDGNAPQSNQVLRKKSQEKKTNRTPKDLQGSLASKNVTENKKQNNHTRDASLESKAGLQAVLNKVLKDKKISAQEKTKKKEKTNAELRDILHTTSDTSQESLAEKTTTAYTKSGFAPDTQKSTSSSSEKNPTPSQPKKEEAAVDILRDILSD